MAEFFLELFSEEIPARMQAGAAAELERLLKTHLMPLNPQNVRTWYGPRRIAIAADILSQTLPFEENIRGPRVGAPEGAIKGFLTKNNTSSDDLVERDGFYCLRRLVPSIPAHGIISHPFTVEVWKLAWPKSMRWGQSGRFTWVRPLRRVACVLSPADGEFVMDVGFPVGPIMNTCSSEGHRFMAPGVFGVRNAAQWEAELEQRFVIASAERRRRLIEDGLINAAASKDLTIVLDSDLIEEVTGLVEWPVCLLGTIEPRQMELPPEVRELSMKVNQRYFATRDASGRPAPYFAFVSNIEASDGGATIIAGNERVLRARLADAEHFWKTDRQYPLEYYLERLKLVTFHAKIGTQFERALRIECLAREIAERLGVKTADIENAAKAGLLCKADLVTGMVGEFPELQGIIGGYYAGDNPVGEAIRAHYQPKGPIDSVPRGNVACAVALADKIDTLREFFRIGERPTGSGDPYALRRMALGIIRIILENELRLELIPLVGPDAFEFIIERMRVKLRAEGRRFDVLNAVFYAFPDDDLTRIVKRAEALSTFLASPFATTLVGGYRRASNILRIEEEKDGPHQGDVNADLLVEEAEFTLNEQLDLISSTIQVWLDQEEFVMTMINLSNLWQPVDAFFKDVTVNADDPALRRNRLRLLAKLRDIMHRVADFSKLEG
ncbi:MAG: glycine--tRNA ligase subunit beta [Acidiphilium sp.]|nr:glycine--tRNA ligase subunit beta [Acidiphilium sp.]MDD4935027.1 glycine--tRNA ligase subunit beta [Acidiphilium sp.]